MPFRFPARPLVFLATLLLCTQNASSAELTLVSFRYSDDAPVVHLRLEGEIRAEDGERVEEVFAQLARCSGAACNNDFGGPRAVVFATAIALTHESGSDASLPTTSRTVPTSCSRLSWSRLCASARNSLSVPPDVAITR